MYHYKGLKWSGRSSVRHLFDDSHIPIFLHFIYFFRGKGTNKMINTGHYIILST